MYKFCVFILVDLLHDVYSEILCVFFACFLVLVVWCVCRVSCVGCIHIKCMFSPQKKKRKRECRRLRVMLLCVKWGALVWGAKQHQRIMLRTVLCISSACCHEHPTHNRRHHLHGNSATTDWVANRHCFATNRNKKLRLFRIWSQSRQRFVSCVFLWVCGCECFVFLDNWNPFSVCGRGNCFRGRVLQSERKSEDEREMGFFGWFRFRCFVRSEKTE